MAYYWDSERPPQCTNGRRTAPRMWLGVNSRSTTRSRCGLAHTSVQASTRFKSCNGCGLGIGRTPAERLRDLLRSCHASGGESSAPSITISRNARRQRELLRSAYVNHGDGERHRKRGLHAMEIGCRSGASGRDLCGIRAVEDAARPARGSNDLSGCSGSSGCGRGRASASQASRK